MRLFALVLSVALPLAVYGDHLANAHLNRAHHEVAKRASAEMHIYKRFSNSKFSWYYAHVGPGACGIQNSDDSYTVAINSPQYGGGSPGPNCFKSITISYNGKTAIATIMDECLGCPYGGLDLTPGLFRFFEPHLDIVYGEWWFNDGTGQPKPSPITTKAKPPPSSTSVWVPPSTSSSKKPASSTHSSTPASASSVNVSASSSIPLPSTTASVNYASGAASGLAIPTGVINTASDEPQNLNSLNELFINIGGLIMGSANSE
ncbi:hypothetical protein BDQ12DRAFT_678348 [Crucibulum laeve]|uniref:RlpA-like double-psi beta-barrel-protein domain-containing protein-containing protein n=1 Tax=Crucibulum laeve TaxID=68775 RepID=A0A5C3M8V6_9AGAR|nr:hypothetical protein BDQ12DRAFT_678348 [Crucibulum laeve]